MLAAAHVNEMHISRVTLREAMMRALQGPTSVACHAVRAPSAVFCVGGPRGVWRLGRVVVAAGPCAVPVMVE